MAKRLKGDALRRYVRRQQALNAFPLWRKRLAAANARLEGRTHLQCVYLTLREQGMSAVDALLDARESVDRTRALYGEGMYATTLGAA